MLRLHNSPEFFYKRSEAGGAISQQGNCEVEPKGFLSIQMKDGMRPVGVECKEAGRQVADCSSDVPAFQCWKWYLGLFIYLLFCPLTSPPLQKPSASHSCKDLVMTSGLPQSPAYARSSPCAVGVLIAAGTLLLESNVKLFLMEKITWGLTVKGYHHIFWSGNCWVVKQLNSCFLLIPVLRVFCLPLCS